jgi:hypothetical protein
MPFTKILVVIVPETPSLRVTHRRDRTRVPLAETAERP